jgi:DNA-binding response OmpR family regulator
MRLLLQSDKTALFDKMLSRIVLVDDEPTLLASMCCYLSRLGHEVIAFQSSVAAWEYFASKGPVPDVVIVDLTSQA